jgi:hypothetical protein
MPNEINSDDVQISLHRGAIYATFIFELGMDDAVTITYRLPIPKATNIHRQLGQMLTEWHLENQPKEHADPHERAALMEEHYEQQADIERDLMFAEPF